MAEYITDVDMVSLLENDTLFHGRYYIKSGEYNGENANIYYAFEDEKRINVIIKEYAPEQLPVKSQDFLKGQKAFQQEIEIDRRISDVNGIYHVIDSFDEAGTSYIVYESQAKTGLNMVLTKYRNRISDSWKKRVLLAVLYTLRELHGRGIVCRDLSENNITLTARGEVRLEGVFLTEISEEYTPQENIKKCLDLLEIQIQRFGDKAVQESADELIEYLAGDGFLPDMTVDLPKTGLNMKQKSLLGICGAAFFAVLILLIINIININNGNIFGTASETITVADDGESLEKFRKRLADIGITDVSVIYYYDIKASDEMVFDTGMGTEISAKKLKKNNLTLYAYSNKRVTIPDCSQTRENVAVSVLRKRLGTLYKYVTSQYGYYGDKDNRDMCVSQNCSGTVSVNSARHLVMVYSWGNIEAYQKEIPDLRGMTTGEAKQKLKAVYGTSVRIEHVKAVYSSYYEYGEIIEVKSAVDMFGDQITKKTVLNSNSSDRRNYNVPQEIKVVVSLGRNKKADDDSVIEIHMEQTDETDTEPAASEPPKTDNADEITPNPDNDFDDSDIGGETYEPADGSDLAGDNQTGDIINNTE